MLANVDTIYAPRTVKETLKQMPSHINFKPKMRKIIETLLYLAHNVSELTDYKCAKLIYLADKEHLNRYNRPITFDRFVAMNRGPVPSVTYDVIKKDRITLNKYEIDPDSIPFKTLKKAGGGYDISCPTRPIIEKIFSKTDLKILDETIAKYADKNDSALYELTHSHTAYTNAWEAKDKGGKSKDMLFEDMIDDTDTKEDLIETLRYIAPAIS